MSEIGSISQAAEACYITQQGLSCIISNLEKELGVPFSPQQQPHRAHRHGRGGGVYARELMLYRHMLMDVSQDGRAIDGFPVSITIYTTQLISATFCPGAFRPQPAASGHPAEYRGS